MSTFLTFHGASFILHAHKRLDFDLEDIGRIIIELPWKLQENSTSESEKASRYESKRDERYESKRDELESKRDELFGVL